METLESLKEVLMIGLWPDLWSLEYSKMAGSLDGV